MRNVLFLCTGNSARSIIAETLLNEIGKGVFQAYSAGSDPTGKVNPHAVVILKLLGYSSVSQARSKSWDEFSGDEAPELDLVVTLCDQAAGEVCPVWPGAPLQIHWGFPDPAAKKDDQIAREAFMDVYDMINDFISALIRVRLEDHTTQSFTQAIREQMETRHD